jgi:hypothetical protein
LARFGEDGGEVLSGLNGVDLGRGFAGGSLKIVITNAVKGSSYLRSKAFRVWTDSRLCAAAGVRSVDAPLCRGYLDGTEHMA